MIGITLQRGRYEIIQELGNDGIKVTYLAKDHYLPVTPKPLCIIKRFQPLRLDPFRQKAEVLYKLGKSYDQIPNIYDYFDENLEFYIVEEHIEGDDLSEEITPGRQWNEAEVVRFLQEILEVLAHVHQQGIIHWNIKPSNIRRRDSDGKLFLIDFGIAKEIISKGNFLQKMLIDTTVGTSGYMPKEQDKGNTQLCSDVYAVGMTALQALTGALPDKLPIDRKTKEVIWRDITEVSDRLANVLSQMVRSEFHQRYLDANEALQAVTQAVVPITVPSPVPILPPERSVTVLPPEPKQTSNDWCYIDKTGRVVIQPQFEGEFWNQLGSFSEALVAVKMITQWSRQSVSDKWGYIDSFKQIVVQPQFDEAYNFSEGLAAVKIDNKWGYIDSSGQVVIQPQFDEAYNFSEGLAAVKIGDKWGYIDSSGQIVIQAQFEQAYRFSEKLAPIQIDNKWGYIDSSGQVVIQPQFDGAWSFSEGLASVQAGWYCKRGYISKSGQFLIQPSFSFSGYFSEGLAPIQIGHQWGYIDYSGQIVIQPQFERAWSFSKGLARVKAGDNYGYVEQIKPIEKTQLPINSSQSSNIFDEGLAPFLIGNKYGYVNQQRQVVIPPQFDEAKKFSQGLAAVKITGKRGLFASSDKWGYIHRTGQVVIQPQFDEAGSFSGGTASVKIGNRWRVIDKKGKFINR